MSVPAEVLRAVEARLGRVVGVEPVGGGCIHGAARLRLAGGSAFLKHHPSPPAGLFAGEGEALERLRGATTLLRVPEVLAVGEPDAGGGHGWLALEWLEPGGAAPDAGERLGRGLAELHGARGAAWGWHRDGFIGTLPQPNAPTATWADFWGERRLGPQLRLAEERGRRPGSRAAWDRLLSSLPGLLAPAVDDGPSLLHGDLWSGNVVRLAGGGAALVDPAAYHGHGEVDLAMAELFGGFPDGFVGAYVERRPLAPGYAEVRREVYQLYYLLVHVNLFGGAYGRQTERVLERVLHAG